MRLTSASQPPKPLGMKARKSFSGPLIADVMAQTGMDGSELNLVALNDYAAAMPWSDIVDFPVILATRLNGETMAVRDKGPLFVIYPFDEHPELKNEVLFLALCVAGQSHRSAPLMPTRRRSSQPWKGRFGVAFLSLLAFFVCGGGGHLVHAAA